MTYNRDALLDLLRSESLQLGEFTLASGKKASYYLDCRNITLHPKGANLIAEGMLDVMRQSGPLPDAVPDGPLSDTLQPDTVLLPDTTLPDTTLPDTTLPDTTLPDTTLPDTTLQPDTTLPDTTLPDGAGGG